MAQASARARVANAYGEQRRKGNDGKWKRPRAIANGGEGEGRGKGGDDGRSRAQIAAEAEALERELGFDAHEGGVDRVGWLINVSSTEVEDKESGKAYAAVCCYFMSEDGSTFKARVKYAPYLYVAAKTSCEHEVEALLRRKYSDTLLDVEIVDKEDLDLKNHLSGLRQTYLKVSCATTQELMDIRREIMPIVEKNKKKSAAAMAYEALAHQESVDAGTMRKRALLDYEDAMVDIREYDVPYHMRYLIDSEVRCGKWYSVRAEHGLVTLTLQEEMLTRGEVRVCAFDIETTKLPLKFPDAEFDQVFMMSYMLDQQGYLIINREVVSEDVQDFEFTPKPEYKGPFIVWNEPNEAALLRRWFDHMREVQPSIYVTYNGDYFDFPFVETRAKKNGMDMYREIGFKCDPSGECRSKFALHLDAFAWVKRDSYLPAGSHGLKAVTKAKLGYDPVEVDPEDMLPYAQSKPQMMAAYSVSDAVSTYYLYMSYVHPFIFALSTIIPLSPDEVLRKGSGTLCEALLMVEAYRGNIICPNKQISAGEQYYNGHLLSSETYIGGHVECLESGVFRSDIPCDFRLNPAGYQELLDNLDDDLEYALRVEGKGMKREDSENYDEIRAQIVKKLEHLRDNPNITVEPLIYHLDVAAMYPNIILTNRLQPPAIVDEDTCAGCDFNRPGKTCLREMEWVWRGEHFASSSSEYSQIKAQLLEDRFPPLNPGEPQRFWTELSYEEQQEQKKNRLKKYTQKVYKKVLDKPVTTTKTAGICMRENPFYIDTVKAFRDRRYEYKGLNKHWKGKLEDAKRAGNPIEIQRAADMGILYDSLQLAHKCILNSFYGYVMRKGARWYSMEMAGVVTNTGAKIIQMAKRLVDDIGKPLELDTDGIWCCLPATFPEEYAFNMAKGKKYKISYPCVVLNRMTALRNTNDQYQTLVNENGKSSYKTSSEMSIEFEVDGPYKAMVLPASKEEGVLIKKRYAVFNHDGSLAELKGFELKRRGELKLIKVFQSEVFEQFLKGDTLKEVYQSVGAIANRWLDMLWTKGANFEDEELLEFISESSVMSKSLEEYGDRKSCPVTTARRLSQFLGVDLIKDKGLVCKYIIANKPFGAPTSERAIPVSIFNAEVSVARTFLKAWTKDAIPGQPDEMPDMREMVDWEYYKTRLSGAIQKIITIPAALQHVENPCPRVKHPDWLGKRIREKADKFSQRNLKTMFSAAIAGGAPLMGRDMNVVDMEDSGVKARTPNRPRIRTFMRDEDAPRTPENATPAVQRTPASAGGDQSGSAAEQREANYSVWLENAKSKWKKLRVNLKRMRQDDAAEIARAEREGGVVRRKRRSSAQGLESFVESREEIIALSALQIIQVEQTKTPGVYGVWVYVNGGMQTVKVTIPRRLVVAMRDPDRQGDLGLEGKRRITMSLPRGFEAPHLYEVNISEEDFLSSGTAVLLADPAVIGVYEKYVPLRERLVQQLGCVMAVKRSKQREAMQISDALYDAGMFQMKTTTEISYLPKLEHIAFYFAGISGDKGRGIYILHDHRENVGVVVVHQPGGGVKEVTAALWSKFLRECDGVESTQAEEEIVDDGAPTANGWTVLYARNMQQVSRHLNLALGHYVDGARGATVLIVEAPASSGIEPTQGALSVREGLAGRLSALMPASGRLPIIAMPPNSSDSALDTVGWQLDAAKIASRRITHSAQWLKEHVDIARYAHVPVGNLHADWCVHTADTFFARALADDEQVLWTGLGGVPDLGGGASGVSLSDLDGVLEASRTEVTNVGAFRSVCVELKAHHLVVCAIVNSGILNDLEHGALLGFETGTKGATRSGGHEAAGAFKTLRKLISNWLLDATDYGNEYADKLLQQLQRWLFSPLSALREPALRHLIELCMKKVFTLLLAEIRKLQVEIVYADMRRIIVATGKHDLASASSCIQGLKTSLHKRELFSWLELEPVKQWHSLLFRGPFDYAGIAAVKLPGESQWHDSVAPADYQLDPQALRDGEHSLDMVWNIALFLPEAVREHFYAIVGEYLLLPWKHDKADDVSLRGRTPSKTYKMLSDSEDSDIDSDSDTEKVSSREKAAPPQTPGAHNARDLDRVEEEKTMWLEAQLESHFGPKILRLAQAIHAKIGLASTRAPLEHQFPSPPGAHLSKELRGTPALAFVKTVLEVLSLDARLTGPVAMLRRNALRLLRVAEFAPEAEFVDPCVSFTLRDAMCSYCSDCRDLDLCRDPDLAAGRWACLTCAQPYDLQWIEGSLVSEVNERVRRYQLQDLKCSRDGRVKIGHLANRCACGGLYKCSAKPGALNNDLRVFSNIADAHDFKVLRDTVDWVTANTSARN